MADNLDKKIDRIAEDISNVVTLGAYYTSNMCFRAKCNQMYKTEESGKIANKADKLKFEKNFNLETFYFSAIGFIFNRKRNEAKEALKGCIRTESVKTDASAGSQIVAPPALNIDPTYTPPFDSRIRKINMINSDTVEPFNAKQAKVSTSGYSSLSESAKSKITEKEYKKYLAGQQAMLNDAFYYGVPSLMNDYSITRLYGSNGGEKLVEEKGQRKWYEINSPNDDNIDYSKNPTTSTLVSWGNADPYGRTPYSYQDFVFCKYWNIIPNNRLITLRRYAAPIVDNLKFPGMEGTDDNGKQKQSVMFPPIASAITYFGEGTGNSLSQILKITTGLNWDDVTADIYNVNTQSGSEPNNDPNTSGGPGAIFPKLASLSRMLSITSGKANNELIMNNGQMPPDPYENGPYSNRIMGPVNRIDTVKKRKAGLKFENKISLVFEYTSRPIGGINTKAVMIDILSNIASITSATAVFWGGQHRFMANPAMYPFMGSVESWYKGDLGTWAKTTAESFAKNVSASAQGGADFAKGFFSNLLGGGGSGDFFGSLANLFTGKDEKGKDKPNAVSNVIANRIAEKTKGQIPYLNGLKALLIGLPVGEWHVTIGNPLNPIAMVGNLICTGMTFEFGEELGPDDFPTTLKFTIDLEHGMPRDKDAILSIFNRGMGRVYDLDDKIAFSSDNQTEVDKFTGKNGKYTNGSNGAVIASPGQSGRRFGPSATKQPSNNGNISIWPQHKFDSIPADGDIDNTKVRSKIQNIEWIAKLGNT